MKFSELIHKIEAEINSIRKNDEQASFFKMRAYLTVIAKIHQAFSDSETVSESEINDLQITQNMKEKLISWLKHSRTSKSPILTHIRSPKRSPSKTTQTLTHNLLKIMGIGPVLAQNLISNGLKSVDDLRQKKWVDMLPAATQTFLKYNPDRKIPHEEMVELEPRIVGFNKAKVIMVGSYRRGVKFSRDFDIMIVSDSVKIMSEYVDYLKKIFNVYEYSSGKDRMSLLVETTGKVYKFDIFRAPKSAQYSMLLYSTGSKLFNIRMRSRAKKMGYLLNQNGLFDADGNKFNIRSEKGFMTTLGMPYLEPYERE